MAPSSSVRRRGVPAGGDGTTGTADPATGKLADSHGHRKIPQLLGLLGLLLVLLAVLAFQRPLPARGDARRMDVEVWASAKHSLDRALQTNVSCAPKPGGDGTGASGLCGSPRRANDCARFVLDDAVPFEYVQELKNLVEWLVLESWGAGAGPPSVIDLHAETISYKEQFVNLTALMEFKQLSFTKSQILAYQAVRQALRQQLSQLFGVPIDGLQHDMTFFSHINASKTAKNIHDEYWHTHIDTDQYGTFAYTTLLYLNTQGQEFNGGEFIFEDTQDGDSLQPGAAVEPRFGRMVAFTSDSENPHKVLPVEQGVRMTLTAAFTCSKEKAASIEPFPKISPIDVAFKDNEL